MSKQGHRAPVKLDDEPLWVEANALAELIYATLADLPEEEKWNTESRLRQEANGLVYYAALAIGNPNPANVEYELKKKAEV